MSINNNEYRYTAEQYNAILKNDNEILIGQNEVRLMYGIHNFWFKIDNDIYDNIIRTHNTKINFD